MRICEICGNELPDDVVICPFCETRQDTGMGPGTDVSRTTGAGFQDGKLHKPGRAYKPGRKSGNRNQNKNPDQNVNENPVIVVVNLKAGKPIVDEALTLLSIKISESQISGMKLIKVIHGWGSSGEGGRIKEALPAHLDELKRRRVIRDYHPGDHYSDSTPRGRHLISKYPELYETVRSDRRNPGITFIEL